jgi:glycosyltransferase involved in cell wall biosynthesis
MINIISTQVRASKINGPFKVFKNLIKGLDKIGYPYVINRDLNATKRLWIQDDLVALRYLRHSKAFKVVGPNLVVMPQEIPAKVDLTDAVYLFPCEWPARLWKNLGFYACRTAIWPVGVDTDEFQPSTISDSERRVIVYHKDRDVQELVTILETLHALHLPYRLVLYGRYSEKDYKELLSETSFIVWHGCHESQGIALQEAMACNIPVLVSDATSLAQAKSSYIFPANLSGFPVTSVPYFDEMCGIRITDLRRLGDAIEKMVAMRKMFQPREFVQKNLSLEKQARELVDVWMRWGLSAEDGYREQTSTSKSFSIPMMDRVLRLARKAQSFLETPNAS